MAEAGDDGGDRGEVATEDVTSDNAVVGDVTGDTAMSRDVGSIDVASEDSAIRDATSAADASIDVASEKVAIRDVGTDEAARSDVCVPTTATEDCIDGIDDDCNGLVDCAETACKTAGYACTGTVPSGWTGPALLWTGAFGSAAPSCPAGYTSVIDGNAGPTGTADTCNCVCTSSGEACSVSGAFHTDQACTSASCATVQVASGGACASVVSTSNCGSSGSFTAPSPTPSGGMCSPQVTTTPGTAAGWTTSGRICSWAGAVDTPGGCSAGQQCVGPTNGFGASLCVYSTADPAPSSCPPGYNTTGPTVLFSGQNDTRGCGTCTCGGSPSGGSCAGTIAFYGTNAGGCSGASPPTFTLGMKACNGSPTITGFSYGGLNNVPGYAQPSIAVTAGTCAAPSQQPPATGGVAGTGPTTVCCK